MRGNLNTGKGIGFAIFRVACQEIDGGGRRNFAGGVNNTGCQRHVNIIGLVLPRGFRGIPATAGR